MHWNRNNSELAQHPDYKLLTYQMFCNQAIQIVNKSILLLFQKISPLSRDQVAFVLSNVERLLHLQK